VGKIVQDYDEGYVSVYDYRSGLTMRKLWDSEAGGYYVEIRDQNGELVAPPYFDYRA
jgi:hypothetical protein